MSNRRRRRPIQAIVRADASTTIGTGHVMRCLALADELRARGWELTFAITPAPGDLRDVVREAGHATSPPEALAEGTGPPADWLIVDHYGLGADWLRTTRRVARRRLVVDDLGDRRLDCDVLVDGNLDADNAKYRGRVRGRPRMLLGPHYALLRPEFAEARRTVRPVARAVTRVAVSMGGGDAANGTELALRAVRAALPNAWIDVILGRAYEHPEPELDGRGSVHRSTKAVAEILAKADLAIGAGGTSALERAALGLPTIMLRLAANQVGVARAFETAGMAQDAGWARDLDVPGLARMVSDLASDFPARRRMRRTCLARVDGLGVRRVAGVIDPIALRKASRVDRDLLLAWANDPVTRENSLSTRLIGHLEHEAWLKAHLADHSTELLIGENGRGPVGQLRLERHAGWADISISVAPEARGGTGGALLAAGLARWRRRERALRLRAHVKEANLSSRRMFERSGFVVVEDLNGVLTYEYGTRLKAGNWIGARDESGVRGR